MELLPVTAAFTAQCPATARERSPAPATAASVRSQGLRVRNTSNGTAIPNTADPMRSAPDRLPLRPAWYINHLLMIAFDQHREQRVCLPVQTELLIEARDASARLCPCEAIPRSARAPPSRGESARCQGPAPTAPTALRPPLPVPRRPTRARRRPGPGLRQTTAPTSRRTAAHRQSRPRSRQRGGRPGTAIAALSQDAAPA